MLPLVLTKIGAVGAVAGCLGTVGIYWAPERTVQTLDRRGRYAAGCRHRAAHDGVHSQEFLDRSRAACRRIVRSCYGLDRLSGQGRMEQWRCAVRDPDLCRGGSHSGRVGSLVDGVTLWFEVRCGTVPHSGAKTRS